MDEIRLDDINILDIGNTIQIAGTVWAGKGVCFITPGPNSVEDFSNIKLLKLSIEDWQKFLRQADIMETEILKKDDTGIIKAIFRKSQRQIDSVMQWVVFKRDNYSCVYCGRTGIPLTVDHIVLWEKGGPTIPENLVAACRSCNKDRGNTEYSVWIKSNIYKKKSANLNESQKTRNIERCDMVSELEQLAMKNLRGR